MDPNEFYGGYGFGFTLEQLFEYVEDAAEDAVAQSEAQLGDEQSGMLVKSLQEARGLQVQLGSLTTLHTRATYARPDFVFEGPPEDWRSLVSPAPSASGEKEKSGNSRIPHAPSARSCVSQGGGCAPGLLWLQRRQATPAQAGAGARAPVLHRRPGPGSACQWSWRAGMHHFRHGGVPGVQARRGHLLGRRPRRQERAGGQQRAVATAARSVQQGRRDAIEAADRAGETVADEAAAVHL
eukprot:scaffold609_cov234-Pinguiococcus_pyrenoidosus.AAC.4